MAKTDDKKGSVVFYLAWWTDRLQYMTAEKQAEILSRFFNICCGFETFDPSVYNKDHRPDEIEIELISMIKQVQADEEKYASRCQTNSENAKRTATERKQSQANASETEQSQAIATERKRTLPNASERPYYDNDNDNDSFFLAREHAREADASKKEKKEILFDLTCYFLSQGVKKPYTQAEAAWNYNEATGWISESRNGTKKDHSHDKYAYLKGWSCEKACYGLNHGLMFAYLCQETDMTEPAILDAFVGAYRDGTGLHFLMDSAKQAQAFVNLYRNDEKKLNKAVRALQEHDETIQGFIAEKQK